MRDASSPSRGRPTVPALAGGTLGLHALVFVAYSLRVGVPAPQGLYLGPRNLVLWLLTFAMWSLLFAAVYFRQPGARWVLIAFLTYAATVAGIPSLLSTSRQLGFGAVLASGAVIAAYLALAVTLAWSPNVRAYLKAERATAARWAGSLSLLAACGIVVMMLVLGSMTARSLSP